MRLGSLLVDPPYSLVRQAYAPRFQTHGVVNADGFGVGWYVDGDPAPARHRGVGGVWADETFADLARVVCTRATLGAVRSATPGTGFGFSAAAPFRDGRWLFSHNGAVAGWPDTAGVLLHGLPSERLVGVATDAGALWALARSALDAGASPGAALAHAVERAVAAGGGRLNLLLTDGQVIAATRCGASLFWRRLDGGVVIASEPYDDEKGWNDVPEHHLVEASADDVTVSELTGSTP